MTPETDDAAQRPPLRLVRGDATPEEVAALLAVLSAVSADAAGAREPAARHTSQWASRGRSVRRSVAPGPGGWRASAFPR
ncbi:acyl-CoA carboxylase subunit epsilon [Nostocoides sp. HKS02]|uniref:acyl-CoA carboxylase subunit epsilon n=1 Tax=Nostocoides sp. HKS02 TaxID=1813880 RepID=UPI0012B46709|nr:acyl-CoA carboxylase subunit epsilon [Tetrasphaera sp. HKS02]QGN56637.1 acyl-CoA carboxylase subunit epsilon [Tetrasphaera sp. HKS02]